MLITYSINFNALIVQPANKRIYAGQFLTLDSVGNALPAFPGSIVAGLSADSYDPKAPFGSFKGGPGRMTLCWHGEHGTTWFEQDEEYSLLQSLFINADGRISGKGHKASFVGTVTKLPYTIDMIDEYRSTGGKNCLAKVLGFQFETGAMMPAPVAKGKRLT
jgi:hypothetical protein